jgi:hypothetical protein
VIFPIPKTFPYNKFARIRALLLSEGLAQTATHASI